MRQDDDRNPDFCQNLEAQRCATVEKNIAGSEKKNDLIKRRVGLDIDQTQHRWPDEHADNQEESDIRNIDFFSQKTRDNTDGQNNPAGKQYVFCSFDRRGRSQFLPLSHRYRAILLVCMKMLPDGSLIDKAHTAMR